jgi:hypothetical protein
VLAAQGRSTWAPRIRKLKHCTWGAAQPGDAADRLRRPLIAQAIDMAASGLNMGIPFEKIADRFERVFGYMQKDLEQLLSIRAGGNFAIARP